MNKPVNTAGNADSPRQTPRPIPAGAEFQAGAVVNNSYEIVDYLGRGAMGFVYRARHLILSKEYALKTLGADQVNETAWRRFQNEAQAIAKMNHPNVVGIHNFGLHRTAEGFDIPYYVMDLLEGGNLMERLRDHGAVPLTVAVRIFQQAAAGLGYAHSKGIIHRDVKPGNIVLLNSPDSTGAILKIVDFGIAKLTDNELYSQKLTNAGEVFGSPYYMSPEQSMALKIDSRTDIYSLGVSLFETLAGVTPFGGKSAVETMINHQTAPVPDISTIAGKNFPADLQSVLEIMMAKKPDDRYQTMQQVIADLSALEHGKRPSFQTYLPEGSDDHSDDHFGFRQALSEPSLLAATRPGPHGGSNSLAETDDSTEKQHTNLPKVVFLSLAGTILVLFSVFSLIRFNDEAKGDTQKSTSKISSVNGSARSSLSVLASTVNGSRDYKNLVGQAAGKWLSNSANEHGSSFKESSDLIESGMGELELVVDRGEKAVKDYTGQQVVSLNAQKLTAKYSSLKTIGGIRYRSFKFPHDVFIGSIYSSELRMEKNAQDAWEVPESARLCYSPSLVVAKYPQFLKRFRAGDIYSLSLLPMACSNQLLEQVSLIPEVHELSIKYCKRFTPSCYSAFAKFKTLDLLDLSGSNVDGATLAKAKSLGTVKKILWSDAVKPGPFLRQVAGSPNLVALNLTGSHLTPEDFHAIAQMPNLKSLEIAQNKLSTDDLRLLSRLSQLTELNVQECGLKQEAVPVLKRFHSLRDLKILSKGTPARMSEALFKGLPPNVIIH